MLRLGHLQRFQVQPANGEPRPWQVATINGIWMYGSMGWFTGKSTGNLSFSREIWDVPVFFPLNQAIVWMDGWMDGWMDACIDACVDACVDIYVYIYIYIYIDVRIDVCIDVCVDDVCVDACMQGMI